MKVSVTQEHINEGVRNRSDSCPIALALRDCGLSEPEVGDFHIGYSNHEGDQEVGLPVKAQAFVHEFDWGCDVEQFEFDIDIDVKDIK